LYRPLSWCLSVWVIELFYTLACACIFTPAVYWTVNLYVGARQFWVFLLYLWETFFIMNTFTQLLVSIPATTNAIVSKSPVPLPLTSAIASSCSS
jgi:hypothetical protein